MIVTVRIFPSETPAREAARKLEQEGFKNVTVLTASADDAEAVARKAAREGKLPGSHARITARSLAAGRAVVALPTPFGSGLEAVEILGSFGPVDTELLPPYARRNPAPMSEFLGLPVLSSAKPQASLSKNPYTFGTPKLINKAAPFSSLFGLKTLTSGKSTYASGPVPKRNPAPFSSLFRFPTLTRDPKGKATLFNDPGPFSSFLNLPLLSKRPERDRK